MAALSRSILSFIILAFIKKPDFLSCQSLECNPGDFLALNAFHKQLDNPIDGWAGPISGCCHRPGVICEISIAVPSRVVSLDLGSRRLQGGFVDSLTDLEHLRFLNLSHNLLRGFLPVKLFQMQNLEVLDLSYNDLYGSFHVEISMPLMKSFNISNNNFVGPIEANLCHNASNVETVDLSNNYFSGEVPASIAKCSSLRQLFLNGNHLSGNLPEGIFELRNLQELQLRENRFSGQLSDRVGKLVHLVKLDISDNLFSGSIPNSFSGLTKLEHFSAGSNSFSGPLPHSLVNSPSLSALYLGNNSLSGPISINCSVMIHITYLDLHSNIFDGPIPAELSACHQLTYLDLGRNQKLLSELPSSFQNLRALKHLLLMKASLVNFYAAFQALQHCGNLTTLILNGNFMNEEIPQNPDLQFQMLKTLVIANSQVRGSLPVWLRSCTNLQLLDLSWNQLSGTIPTWVGELNHLFYLDLSLNSLTGGMPESFAKLGNHTNLSFSSMTDSSGISVYFAIPGRRSLKYNSILSLPPTLDLSNNMLNGPIILGLGNLKWLHVLKLHNNSFSGNIPDTLSGMVNLESLDLSLNNLSGEIPPSLVNLNFLSYFNVSFNKLSGVVPSGGQFQTFPISCFIENNGLCNLLLAPCLSDSGQSNWNQTAEERSVLARFRLPFEVGAAAGFVLTVGFCFISGWVFKK